MSVDTFHSYKIDTNELMFWMSPASYLLPGEYFVASVIIWSFQMHGRTAEYPRRNEWKNK